MPPQVEREFSSASEVIALLQTLSVEERTRLHELERVVERNLPSFLEAGHALLTIRDERLYRAYGTFEQYCCRRFGITESRGLALIRSTEIAERLLEGPVNPDNGDAPLPPDLSEDALRPLHGLEPSLQSACWRLATRIGKPTGHLIGQFVRVIKAEINQGSNGSAEGNEPKRHQKQTYLPSVYRLAAGDSFCAQVVVLRIGNPEKAKRCSTNCKILINRLQSILTELERRFPEI
jgi:hypothetical protein